MLKLLFPLTIPAIRWFDFSGFELVLTSSTFCAKDVALPKGVRHVCYCYAPFRPLWEFERYVAQIQSTRLKKEALRLFFSPFRQWDFRAAQKPQELIAISEHAARKIEKAYRRKPAIIYPPVDVDRFSIAESSEDYFLVVSRLMPYKRIDIVVEAFRELPHRLKVVGTGPDLQRLQRLAGPNIEFIGPVSEEALQRYYQGCRCLIFPGEEDFGLVPLEAHACGRPVIAYGAGGALETIVAVNGRRRADDRDEATTGVFFYEQNPDAVLEGIRIFEQSNFDPQLIRKRALRFDKAHFRRRLLAAIEGGSSGDR